MAESNGIVVRGIPQRTHVDDLWKTFERCYSVTCRVEYVIFPLNFNPSTAYVHFTAFPEKAFTLEHQVQGQTVTVEPAPLAVFSKCCAEVDAIIVAGIPDVTECIADLNEEFGVKSSYSPDSGRFLVEGSLLQLQHVTDRLLEVFTHQQRVQQRQLLRLTQYPDMDPTTTVNTAGRPDRFQHQAVTPVENWSSESQQHREGSDRPAYVRDTARVEQQLKQCGHTHCRHTHVHHVGDPIGSTGDTSGHVVTGGYLPHPPCYSDEHVERGRSAGKHFIAHEADAMSPGRPIATGVNVNKVPGYSDPAFTPAGKKLPGHDAGHVDAAIFHPPTGTGTADQRRAGSLSPSSPLSPGLGKDQLECVLPADTATSDLDYYVVEYLLRSEKSRLKTIEQEFGVTVRAVNRVCDEIVTVAFQRFNPTINAQNEQKAQATFLALYETIYRNIIQRTVHVSPSQPVDATKLVDIVHNLFKDKVFASANGLKELILVGSYSQVSDVEMFVQSKVNNKPPPAVSDSVERPGVEDPRPATGKPGTGSGVDDDDSDVELTPMDAFVFKCRDNLSVCVYSADITRLRVDAIVNAANERLMNYGGVAGAIEKAGGDKLREDCKRIVDSDGPLKVAEVVHSAARGRLKCQYVVHTVGPMWTLSSDKSRCTLLLQRTFENVLHYCNHVLKVSSVAIPAIGSGVFEVPLDVCAEAMFKAVQVFADKVTQITLREIHLVNKDPNTTHLIQTVFEHLTTVRTQELSSRTLEEPSAPDAGGLDGRKDEVENRAVNVEMETGTKAVSDHSSDKVVVGTGVETGGKVVMGTGVETGGKLASKTDEEPIMKTVIDEVMTEIGVVADGKMVEEPSVEETVGKVEKEPSIETLGEMEKGKELIGSKMKVVECNKEKCDSKVYERTESLETQQTHIDAGLLESLDQLEVMERDSSGSKLQELERDPGDSSGNLLSEEAGLKLTDPIQSAVLDSAANSNQLDEINKSLEPPFVEPGSFELVSAELLAAQDPTRLD